VLHSARDWIRSSADYQSSSFALSVVGPIVWTAEAAVGSQVVQMTGAFKRASLFAFYHVQVWHILMLSFIVGLAAMFGGPAYQALISPPDAGGTGGSADAIARNSINSTWHADWAD